MLDDSLRDLTEVLHKRPWGSSLLILGDINMDMQPMMGGEDFSYMLNERPGAYIWVGNGDTAMVHHPAYNFNDDAIPAGSSWYAGMVEARLPAA